MTVLAARLTLFVAFVGTVIAANWALARYGVVSVGFGFEVPAGVFAAGLAFGLRDALHEQAGRQWAPWVLAAITAGATLSYVIEDAATIPGGAATIPGGVAPIAVASAAAFLLSELADLVIYTPLRDRSWRNAVLLSNLVGAVIDSALFLWLAFGGLDHLPAQVAGKLVMVAPAFVAVWAVRRRRRPAVA